jgi:chromosome partitioning protein
MHEGQTLQAKTSLSTIQTQLSLIAFVCPPIPRTIAFPDSAQMHEPLSLHSPKQPVVEILNQIADFLETL